MVVPIVDIGQQNLYNGSKTTVSTTECTRIYQYLVLQDFVRFHKYITVVHSLLLSASLNGTAEQQVS